MDLGTIIQKVRYNLDEADAAFYTDDELAKFANDGELDIASKTGCIERIEAAVTTIGNRLIPFGGTFITDVEVDTPTTYFSEEEIIMWRDLDPIGWADMSQVAWYDRERNVWVPYPSIAMINIVPAQLGHVPLRDDTTPQYWFQWGSYLVVEPIPNAVYNLNIYRSITPDTIMILDNDSPSIPIEFHDMIVVYATILGLLKARRYSDASSKYTEYTSILQGLLDRYVRRRKSMIKRNQIPRHVAERRSKCGT